MTWSRSFGERILDRGLWLGEQAATHLGRVASLGDWFVETHVSDAIFQATEACRQFCSMEGVLARFVVIFAVDTRLRKGDSDRMSDGSTEQALSSQGNASVALAHL